MNSKITQFSCGCKEILYSLEKSLHITLFVEGLLYFVYIRLNEFFSHLKCQNLYIDLSNDYGKFRVEIKQRLSKFKKWSTSLNLVRCLQLTKMNITPLAILVIKWPFSKERGG